MLSQLPGDILRISAQTVTGRLRETPIYVLNAAFLFGLVYMQCFDGQ